MSSINKDTGFTSKMGNMMNTEFKDLLKYIAVSKGSTNVPDGLEPMSFRPGNLPPKSEEEKSKVAKLVEQNRKEYAQK